MKSLKTLFQIGALAALTATFAVACAPPDNKTKVSDLTDEQKVKLSLGKAFSNEYDPTLPQNMDLAGRIEGASANISKNEGSEEPTFDVQVQFVIKDVEGVVVGRLEKLPASKSTELPVIQGSHKTTRSKLTVPRLIAKRFWFA